MAGPIILLFEASLIISRFFIAKPLSDDEDAEND